VIAASAGACLHLKTGTTYAGDGVLLFNPQAIDPSQFAGVEPLPVDEPLAANCVRVGGRLILPAGNPRTAARLHGRGFDVVEIDVSELEKAEAGVTCMSLIDPRE
jgi:dimethylargininase